MIRLDLAGISDEELKITVTRLCAQYGRVDNVVIVREERRHDFALAAVEMADSGDALELLRQLGDTKVGSMVVIRIEQEDKPEAPATKPRSRRG